MPHQVLSLKDIFETDPDLEKEGRELLYCNSIRLTLARAGGHNAEYQRVLNAAVKPIQRLLDLDKISERTERRVMQEVYAKAVSRKWEYLVGVGEPDADGNFEKVEWRVGIDGRGWTDQDTLDPNVIAHVHAVFEQFPDLWSETVAFANKMANYRRKQLESEAKNS